MPPSVAGGHPPAAPPRRDRRKAGNRWREGGRVTARRPARRPQPHGHPPWRRARCGLCGAWVDNTVSAGWTTGGSSLLAALLLFLLQRGQHRERMRRIIASRRRLKDRIRLARIGIDGEDEEFGRNRAEIDRSIDQWFRPVV